MLDADNDLAAKLQKRKEKAEVAVDDLPAVSKSPAPPADDINNGHTGEASPSIAPPPPPTTSSGGISGPAATTADNRGQAPGRPQKNKNQPPTVARRNTSSSATMVKPDFLHKSEAGPLSADGNLDGEDANAPITRADLHHLQEVLLEEIRQQFEGLKKEFVRTLQMELTKAAATDA